MNYSQPWICYADTHRHTQSVWQVQRQHHRNRRNGSLKEVSAELSSFLDFIHSLKRLKSIEYSIEYYYPHDATLKKDLNNTTGLQ